VLLLVELLLRHSLDASIVVTDARGPYFYTFVAMWHTD
jgi:hypothetical protein